MRRFQNKEFQKGPLLSTQNFNLKSNANDVKKSFDLIMLEDVLSHFWTVLELLLSAFGIFNGFYLSNHSFIMKHKKCLASTCCFALSVEALRNKQILNDDEHHFFMLPSDLLHIVIFFPMEICVLSLHL